MERHLLSLAQQTDSVQKIVGSLDNSTAFEAALKHQQDAVMATTRTHRVLNELLDKVTEAGLVSDEIESLEDLPVVEQLVTQLTDLDSFAGSESKDSIKIYEEETSEPLVAEAVAELVEPVSAPKLVETSEPIEFCKGRQIDAW